MLASDGQPMARVPARKVKFYLGKGLAHVVSDATEDEETIIMLNFEPGGYGHRDDAGNLAQRKDACVACSAESELHRFSVVPPAFRCSPPVNTHFLL